MYVKSSYSQRDVLGDDLHIHESYTKAARGLWMAARWRTKTQTVQVWALAKRSSLLGPCDECQWSSQWFKQSSSHSQMESPQKCKNLASQGWLNTTYSTCQTLPPSLNPWPGSLVETTHRSGWWKTTWCLPQCPDTLIENCFTSWTRMPLQ